MSLPLFEEVREARRLSEQSYAANVHLTSIIAALTAISVIENQLHVRPDLETDVPGDEIVLILAEAWPELADLPSSGPRPTQPLSVRLHMRRTQLRAAENVLSPLGQAGPERGAALHDLQHRQRHALADPRWAPEVAELAGIGAERDHVANELGPLQQRLNHVDPGLAVLRTCIARLDQDLASIVDTNRDFDAWRVGAVANSLLATLHRLAGQVLVGAVFPSAVALPSRPEPHTTDALTESCRTILADLRQVETAAAREADAVRGQVQTLQSRYQELTRAIVERMG